MEAVITIEDLVVQRGKATVLSGLSATLAKGKITGLLGSSGAGKTTLIRTLVGAQKITSGVVKILDQSAGARKLRSQIGYMPQDTATYPDLTVQENLEYFAAMQGLDTRLVQKAIKNVDLFKQRHQLVSSLSGGQASRVSLAVALLGSPKILFLDEPTSGLDPVLRQNLWQLFRKLAQNGISLIISSHVMDEATRCDDLLLVHDGKFLAYGTPKEICQQTGATDVEQSFLKLIEGNDA